MSCIQPSGNSDSCVGKVSNRNVNNDLPCYLSLKVCGSLWLMGQPRELWGSMAECLGSITLNRGALNPPATAQSGQDCHNFISCQVKALEFSSFAA